MMKKFEFDVNILGVDFFVKGKCDFSKSDYNDHEYSSFETDDIEVYIEDQEVSKILNEDAWEEIYREIEENIDNEEEDNY